MTRLKQGDDLEWEIARRRAQQLEERKWAEALASAKARALEDDARAAAALEAEDEARQWEHMIAEARQRAQREEREWATRRSIAAGPVVPYEYSVRPAPKRAAPHVHFWP